MQRLVRSEMKFSERVKSIVANRFLLKGGVKKGVLYWARKGVLSEAQLKQALMHHELRMWEYVYVG